MYKLVFSDNPSVIEWQVQQTIAEEGFDLDGSPFVLAGNFCQPMRTGVPIFEYKLISAFLPSEFENTVKQMEHDKWRLDGNPVDWNGAIFQWMLRLKARPLAVGHEATVNVATSAYAFNLVESVLKITFPLSVLPGASNG